jgi:oxygen-independent coproporphyrinogen-3 oxidase
MLDLKDNSRLASQIAAKRIEPPEDELMAQMWDLLVSQCISGGYEHYEISNFAMPGHRSTHNMKYWRDKEFIGFGAAASSMTGRHRYANTENMEDYINASGNGFLPIENLQELAPFDRFKDSLIMGMRLTNGVDAARLSEDYHIDAFGYLHETIGDLIDLGLFEISGNIFRLTKKGMLLSNQVFVRWL